MQTESEGLQRNSVYCVGLMCQHAAVWLVVPTVCKREVNSCTLLRCALGCTLAFPQWCCAAHWPLLAIGLSAFGCLCAAAQCAFAGR